MKKMRLLYIGAILALLMYLWPNFIHEPIHALVAMLQGVQVKLIPEFLHLPSRPVIAWTGQFSSTAGYYAFLLAPSVIAISILSLLLLSKKTYVETHIALPIYLAMEVSVNVLKYDLPISDFRMLLQSPHAGITAISIAAIVLLGAGAVVARAIRGNERMVQLTKKGIPDKRYGKEKCIVCGKHHGGKPHFKKLETKTIKVRVREEYKELEDINEELARRYYGSTG